jgi:hypothetical protein
MKIIKLTEIQKRKLFNEVFSFEEIKKLSYDRMRQYYYCIRLLGKPIGKGSSRYVFGVDDDFCVKLSMGKKVKSGVAQNINEYQKYLRTKSPLLMKVYDHDSSFNCILVRQAEERDFENILGIPFLDNEKANFVWIYQYISIRYVKKSDYFDRNEEFEKIINGSRWLQDLIKLMANEKITDVDYIENIGVAQRDGKDELVILDFGFTNDIYDSFY